MLMMSRKRAITDFVLLQPKGSTISSYTPSKSALCALFHATPEQKFNTLDMRVAVNLGRASHLSTSQTFDFDRNGESVDNELRDRIWKNYG